MSTSRSDEKNQTGSLDWKALFHDPAYAGSSHLISSALVASSSEKAPDPRMTQSQAVKRPYTVTITPPELSIEDHLSVLLSYKSVEETPLIKSMRSANEAASSVSEPVSITESLSALLSFSCEETPLMKSGFFLHASHASSSSKGTQPSIEHQEKTEFLKAHFPSLFVKGSLMTEPVFIMKDDAEHKDYEEKLRQQPSEKAVAAFNKNGYLIIKHVSIKKCIEKLQELTLEQLKSNDIKKIFEDILEDTISELEPFKSDDDIVLTESGHSYLSAPLTQSLEIKRVDPNTNEALKNNKLVKDAAVKTFLRELDHLVALNEKKSQCNPSC